MSRYVCIHGHFYQPPRENPWLETVEIQDSAYPYHDWNERITAECYAPNATSRILDGEGRIIQLVNNYSRISFNFGPTLLAWMQRAAPEVYEAILQADRESREIFSGHGSALAQAYNHMILPLANQRDRQTQVIWGIKDFFFRFGRRPEGMWLPETAVDLDTLDLLAEHEIRFTILAPNQVRSVRPLGDDHWRDVGGGHIDPRMPYQIALPSGRTITAFVYDGPISQALAFERLLNNGEAFAHRLMDAFSNDDSRAQIVHVATDGETYGHHHRGGDMALAYALHYMQANNLAQVTNYGEFLEQCPPTHEIEIFENSSWSCAHGIERWRGACGCNSGGNPGWNQQWRAPLREALDWLRDTMAPAYEEAAGELLQSPWQARNNYIDVMLDRSAKNVDAFFVRHAVKDLTHDEKVSALKLLELQRHAMLMYTSCGWFFDELSGVETVQVIEYAGRVLQLAQDLFADAIESRFLELLSRAKSNIPDHRDGRTIYEKWVRPAALDLNKVGAHYVISSLFQDYGESTSIGSYSAFQRDSRISWAGKAKLIVGRADIRSEITQESVELSYGVVHFGDHNISCGIRESDGDRETHEAFAREIVGIFSKADLPGTIRALDNHFGGSMYSLISLFRDEQRRVLDQVLEPTEREAEVVYGQMYDHYAPLIRFLTNSAKPVPKSLSLAAEIVLNSRLSEAFQSTYPDPENIQALLDEARLAGVTIDHATLEFALRKNLERIAEEVLATPNDIELVQHLVNAATLLETLPFEVDLTRVQNLCFQLLDAACLAFPSMDAREGQSPEQLTELFQILEEKLGMRVCR